MLEQNNNVFRLFLRLSFNVKIYYVKGNSERLGELQVFFCLFVYLFFFCPFVPTSFNATLKDT